MSTVYIDNPLRCPSCGSHDVDSDVAKAISDTKVEVVYECYDCEFTETLIESAAKHKPIELKKGDIATSVSDFMKMVKDSERRL